MSCYDCGRKYGDEHGFPDLVIPNWAWRRISPTGDDGGLLCPACICERLHGEGIRNVPAAFMSGPLACAIRDRREGGAMTDEERIDRLEAVLAIAITWLRRTLGDDTANMLLAMLQGSGEDAQARAWVEGRDAGGEVG